MDLLENIMEKQNKVGADELGWLFHVYHTLWAIGIISAFIFLDLWLASIIVAIIGFYFVWKY